MSRRAPDLPFHPSGKLDARFLAALFAIGIVAGSALVVGWHEIYVAKTTSPEPSGSLPGPVAMRGTQDDAPTEDNKAPTDASPRIIGGHRQTVGLVAPSPSGERLLSTDTSGTIIVWDYFAGQPLVEFETPELGLRQAALSADGKWVVACGRKPAIELWNASSEKRVRQFEGHTEIVSAVRFIPHQNQFLSASFDRSLIVWDVETGEEVRRFGAATNANAVAPAGVEDLETLDGHYTWIRDVVVLPDGRQAISAGNDAVLFVWDLETGHIVKRLIGHRAPIMALVLSRDGKLVASVGSEDAVIVWDLERGTQLTRIADNVDGRPSVAFTADGTHLAIAGSDAVRFIDVDSGEAVSKLETPGASITSIAIVVSPFLKGSEVICGCTDGLIRIWAKPEIE